MAFNVLFLAHAPDAQPEKHRCLIETPSYKLFVVVVKNRKEGVDVYKRLVKKESIHSILLCPGFTHRDVAKIAETAGKNIAVAVARGDGPSNRVSTHARKEEGWVSEKE
ncbi:MAG: DUF6506 family protein [Candidatus Aerophobetes bacterium]|nr:DUF6506 family protein [Candidatus Aerophobetes bacterium]